MALAYYDVGHLDEAKANFERAMELLSESKEAIVELMDLKASNFYYLYLLSNYDETLAHLAIEQFEKLFKQYSKHEHAVYAYLYYADLLSHLRRYDRAITICLEAEKIVKNDLEKSDVFHILATVYQDKLNFIEAENCYYRSLELYGDNKQFYSRAYYDLGRLYIEKKENEKAEAAFRNALKFRKYSPWLKYRNDYVKEIRGYVREQ